MQTFFIVGLLLLSYAVSFPEYQLVLLHLGTVLIFIHILLKVSEMIKNLKTMPSQFMAITYGINQISSFVVDFGAWLLGVAPSLSSDMAKVLCIIIGGNMVVFHIGFTLLLYVETRRK
jgi:hypothetical protein